MLVVTGDDVVCASVRAGVYVLKIVSTEQILRFINIFIIMLLLLFFFFFLLLLLLALLLVSPCNNRND